MRRAISISVVALLWVTLLGGAIVWIPAFGLVDAVRRARWALVRAGLFLLVLFTAELIGLARALARWLSPSRADWLPWHYRAQRWWVRTLYESALAIYGAAVEVSGDEVASRGPLLMLIRHVGVADTLLPTRLVSDRHGLALRFVLKRELLWDPCLDVYGRRLPNAFVARSSVEREEDLTAVAALREGLDEHSGILIYPEGTRFTAKRRTEILARLANGADAERHERARRLEHLLPPRLGGTLALLEHGGLDVVFCAHVGLEGTTRLADFWRGSLIDARIKVAFWRVSAASIPVGKEAQAKWLYDEWEKVDRWVGANREPTQ